MLWLDININAARIKNIMPKVANTTQVDVIVGLEYHLFSNAQLKNLLSLRLSYRLQSVCIRLKFIVIYTTHISNQILNMEARKNQETKGWLAKKINDFKDQKQFFDLFKKHSQISLSQAEGKHNLRERILQIQQFHGLTELSYETRCAKSKKRPDNPYKCLVLRNCKQYHMFDLKSIYELIKESKVPGVLVCPVCLNEVSSTENIEIDVLSFMFYDSTEDVAVRLVIAKEQIKEEEEPKKRRDAIKTDYQKTVVRKDNKLYLFTLRFDIKSNTFLKQCSNNYEINSLFTELAKRQKTYLNQFIEDNYQPNERNTVKLICPISLRRIFNATIHKDCTHKRIVIFDLEFILMQLFRQDGPKKITCILCENYFSVDNIKAVAVVDSLLRSNIYKEPPYFVIAQFKGSTHFNKSEEAEVSSRLRQLVRNIKLYEDYIDNVKLFAGRFWKGHKYDLNKYNGYIKKIADNPKIQPITKLKLDKQTMAYPVRCTSCNTLTQYDLWYYLALWQLAENKSLCPLNKCKLKNGGNIEKDIYLDIALFRFIEDGIYNVYFNKQEKIYYADVDGLSRNVLQSQLKQIGNIVSSKQYYYQNDFQYHRQKQMNQQQAYILKGCINQPNALEHLQFRKEKKNNLQNFKCGKCNKKAETIFDILYDPLITSQIKKQQILIWSSSQSSFVKLKNKIKSQRLKIVHFEFKELKRKIEQNSQTQELVQYSKYLPKEKKQKLKLTCGNSNKLIQFPIHIISCSHQKKEIEQFLDLQEFINQPVINCFCGNSATYVDQIIYLKSFHQVLQDSYFQLGQKEIAEARYVLYQYDEERENASISIPQQYTVINKNMAFSQIIPKTQLTSQTNTTISSSQGKGGIKIKTIIQKQKKKQPQNIFQNKLAKALQEWKSKYSEEFEELIDIRHSTSIQQYWKSQLLNTAGGIYIHPIKANPIVLK